MGTSAEIGPKALGMATRNAKEVRREKSWDNLQIGSYYGRDYGNIVGPLADSIVDDIQGVEEVEGWGNAQQAHGMQTRYDYVKSVAGRSTLAMNLVITVLL